jgi:hypothetical protein
MGEASAKVSAPGLKALPESATGEPDTGTLAVKVAEPVAAPVAVGANATLTVQSVAAARVAPQFPAPAGNVPVLTRTNGAVMATLMVVKVAVPVLCRVRF